LENSQVIHDLGDIYEMHRTISRLFPNSTNSFRKRFQILYRIDTNKDENAPFLLIQSKIIPNWSQLLEVHPDYFKETPESKEIKKKTFLNNIQEKQEFIFKLKANPVKRPPPNKYGKGFHHGKTNRIPIQNDDQLIKWINRKGNDAGFKIRQIHSSKKNEIIYNMRFSKEPKSTIKTPYRYQKVVGRKKQHKLIFHSVTFIGHLEVINKEKFIESLINGIGPGKAFGFGMLSIYPLRK